MLLLLVVWYLSPKPGEHSPGFGGLFCGLLIGCVVLLWCSGCFLGLYLVCCGLYCGLFVGCVVLLWCVVAFGGCIWR